MERALLVFAGFPEMGEKYFTTKKRLVPRSVASGLRGEQRSRRSTQTLRCAIVYGLLSAACGEEDCYNLKTGQPYEIELMNYVGGPNSAGGGACDRLADPSTGLGGMLGSEVDLRTGDIVGFTVQSTSNEGDEGGTSDCRWIDRVELGAETLEKFSLGNYCGMVGMAAHLQAPVSVFVTSYGYPADPNLCWALALNLTRASADIFQPYAPGTDVFIQRGRDGCSDVWEVEVRPVRED